jgi:hypothetical protein
MLSDTMSPRSLFSSGDHVNGELDVMSYVAVVPAEEPASYSRSMDGSQVDI